jgi:hypothetical protein
MLTQLTRNGKVKSYSIGRVTQLDSTHATVGVTVATDQGAPATAPFPVVKEGGKWKVCLSGAALPGSSGPSDFPTGSLSGSASAPSGAPSISVPPISLPSIPGGFSNPCGFATTARSAAITYVGLAEIGQTDFAQSCVYHDAVSKAVTASIKTSGSGLYSPSSAAGGSTTEFKSIDGSSTLEVTATKEPDGKFYVSKVEKR